MISVGRANSKTLLMLITNDLGRFGTQTAAFCRLVILASAYISMDWFRWDVGYNPIPRPKFVQGIVSFPSSRVLRSKWNYFRIARPQSIASESGLWQVLN